MNLGLVFLVAYIGGLMLGFVAINIGMEPGERRRPLALAVFSLAVAMVLVGLSAALYGMTHL